MITDYFCVVVDGFKHPWHINIQDYPLVVSHHRRDFHDLRWPIGEWWRTNGRLMHLPTLWATLQVFHLCKVCSRASSRLIGDIKSVHGFRGCWVCEKLPAKPLSEILQFYPTAMGPYFHSKVIIWGEYVAIRYPLQNARTFISLKMKFELSPT